MTEENAAPTDEQIRTDIIKTLEHMRVHSVSLTDLANELSQELRDVRERVAGLAETMDSNVDVANSNQDSVLADRSMAATKEILAFVFDKSHQYVTVIIAGGFAAYFATLSTVSARFDDVELRWSALLMTISLTAFVLWEVGNIVNIGFHTMKGDFGALKEVPKWQRTSWVVALGITLVTAIPAIVLSAYTYLRGLIG